MDDLPASQHKPDSSKEEKASFPPDSDPLQSASRSIDSKKATDRDTQERGKKKQVNWPMWIQAGCAVAIVIITLFYTRYAGQQVVELQKATAATKQAADAATESTRVLRQQLVGTQAAKVFLQPTIFGNDGLSITFDHRGIADAREVRFEFSAVRKAIPTLKDIESPIHKIAYDPVLSSDHFSPPHAYSLPGFTPTVLEAIRRTEQTVLVTGTFSYDNGFGDVHTEQVCLYWLSGIPNRTTDQGGSNGFVNCDEFPSRLANILKARKELRENQ